MADLVPPQGESTTLVERVGEYIAPYDPAYVTRCVGMTDADIAAYARVAGFGNAEAVPASYRSFLRGMGRNDGGLLRTVGLDAELDGVLELYDDWRHTEPGSINSHLPVAATYVIGDQVSFDRREVVNAQSPELPLADTGTGEWVAPRARSWEALVTQTAALYVECRRLPLAIGFGSSPTRAGAALAGRTRTELTAMLDAFAAAHDLALAWPSDDLHRIAVGPRHSVFATVRDGNAVLLTVLSTDDAFPRVVRDEFAPLIGAEMTGTLRIANGILQPS